MKAKLTALLLAGIAGSLAFAGDGPSTKPAAVYPLTKCVISDEALPTDGSAIVEKIDGREVHFCCKDCVKAFKKDTEASHKAMDKKIVEATKASYSLHECVVSGEKLGGMGDPIYYVYRPTNQLVEFCCKDCVKQFEKNPEPSLAKIAKAEEAMKAEKAKS